MIDQTIKDALQHKTQTLWKQTGYGENWNSYKEGYNSALTDVQKIIESLPCEKEHAEWQTCINEEDSGFVHCNKCHAEFNVGDLERVGDDKGFVNYCPNCGVKMKHETKNKTEDSSTDLQKNIDTIRNYEALKERFKSYLHCLSKYPDVTEVTWYEDENEFEVWYEETFCGCTDKYSEDFPANIFDMTPEEYKEIVKKKEQEEARRKALEREQNERKLLASLKKKYESDEVKDIFAKAEGILLNEKDK